MKQTIQDLIITAFGAIASLIIAVILFVVEDQFRFAFYSLMLWFFIPVGAILSGFVAASGYYVGARVFGERPSALILFNMIAVSVGTFFTIYYLSYMFMEVNGRFISDAMPFTTYMDLILQHQTLEFRLRGHSVGSTGELGGWGYATAALQILGFAFGGVAVFGYLSSLPYCEQCSRYLKEVGRQDRFTSSGEGLVEKIGEFALLIDQQQFNDAIQFHAQKMGVSASPGHFLRSRIITRTCDKCSLNHLEFYASKLDGDSWKDISGTKISTFSKERLQKVG